METSYLFIKERESQKWFFYGILPSVKRREGRKTRYYPASYVYPKPEAVSPFVESHKIIIAETEEEAWQKLN